MLTINEYMLWPGGTAIDLPETAKVLTVQVKGNDPFMWVLLDTNHQKTKRHFYTRFNGAEITSDNSIYIGTYQLGFGALVCHVFEEPSP